LHAVVDALADDIAPTVESDGFAIAPGGPSTAPRSVAAPEDDHKTASLPLGPMDTPTLWPEALMAETMAPPGAKV
jgi:hypothetical protein